MGSDRLVHRSLVVDGLRGFCFVVMTMDHLPGNPLARFSNGTYGLVGFFSSASGFIFLSGWVAARVYGRHRQVYGDWAVLRRILNRLSKIYMAQVTMFLALFLAVMFGFNGTSKWDVHMARSLKTLVMGVTLMYSPGYLGVLPMYFWFLLFTPLVLWQLQTGHTWRVLAWSGALWVFSGLFVRLPADYYFAFNPLGYQLLFVMGLVVERVQLESFRPSVQRLLIIGSLALTALFFIFRLEYALFASVRILIDRMEPLFSKLQMGPLRLLSFAVFGVTLSWVLQKTNLRLMNNIPSRWLVWIGQNSLPVFVWSILYTYAATAVLPVNATTGLRVVDLILATASLSIPALLSTTAAYRTHRIRATESVSPLLDQQVVA